MTVQCKRKIISLAIIFFLLVPSSLVVFALNNDDEEIITDEIEEKQGSLKEAESQQKEIEEQLKGNQLKESEIIDHIEKIEMDIIEKEKEIERLEEEIDKTLEEIGVTEEELMVAEEGIQDKNELLEARLDVMYRRGSIGYIQVLLSSNSFTELLTNLDMIQKIADHDVNLIEELEEQRDLIEGKKKQLENQQARLEVLKTNTETEKESLHVSRGTQVRLRQEVQSIIAQMEKDLEEMEREAEQVAAEIRKLQEAERKRREEERRRQEEEERRAAQVVERPSGWPVPGYTRISSPFGMRVHPIFGGRRFHRGIDIPAPMGTPIVASAEGVVIISGYYGSYGNMVTVDHGDGIATLYAHNSRNEVSVGDHVQKGQIIARIGSTGNSTGPHLHFEVQVDGSVQNPMDWLGGN